MWVFGNPHNPHQPKDLSKVNAMIGEWSDHEDTVIRLYYVHMSALEALAEVEL